MENKTLAQLREEAKTLGITNVTKYKKDELASLIEEAKPKEEPQKQRTETVEVTGILQVCEDGFGFLRGENYLSCPDDVYVA
ncbi:MAG: Rho termination factor N-terminal domain-containing protein, partial [Clostridia bacterium]|nr:Rho termination factor N-terminal domain-containing protein [Clostridia bacterium]